MNPRYELLQCVSETAQGTVWRALDRETGAQVAVKRPGSAAAFPRLEHPHIVRTLDADAECIVMEWVEGQNLEAVGRLSPSEFDAFVRQSLDAVAALHQAGWLHLDLKPENFIRGAAGFTLLDFGSAKPLASAKADLKGSVHYMAPECFEGGMLDVHTDLYALGCTFHHTLSGKTAFGGELTPQVITAHLQHRFEPLPDSVPLLLRQWIEHLMRRIPSERPRSAAVALATYRDIALIVAAA
jgi:serine/threonine protein kinase